MTVKFTPTSGNLISETQLPNSQIVQSYYVKIHTVDGKWQLDNPEIRLYPSSPEALKTDCQNLIKIAEELERMNQ